ncbi:MAG: dihydrodipicolinate synthase family protein [Streptosporangiales bacterium]|nr:dihydrodipicolinate synthase family protein [Streptosporangiales bacterium]
MPTGISPVLLTPFAADGSLDEAGFVRVVDHVLSLGVGSVMFPGFASEVLTLSDEERDVLVRLLLERTAARSDVTPIVSIAEHATYHAVRRATALAEAGVGTFNVLPPHQLGPSAPAVVAHVEAVLAAVAPAAVILQYAPLQTGTTLPVAEITALAARHQNLAAVKVESQPPGRTIAALGEGTPPLPAFVGYGGVQMPDALRRGAIGVQPGCSFTELYLAVWRLWHDGHREDASRLHTRMLPYLSYWMQDVQLIVAAEKLIAVRRGLVDDEHCRAPARTLDRAERVMVDDFCSEFSAMLPVVDR